MHVGMLLQVGDVHAGEGRKAAVFELMARPDAAIDFAAAMQDAGHLVDNRCPHASTNYCAVTTLWAFVHVPACHRCGRATVTCGCHTNLLTCSWAPGGLLPSQMYVMESPAPRPMQLAMLAQVPGAAHGPAAVGAADGREAGAVQRQVLGDLLPALPQPQRQPGAAAAVGRRSPARQPASAQVVMPGTHFL